MNLWLHSAAKAEISRAARRYQRERHGLENDFLATVADAFQTIQSDPFQYAKADEAPPSKDVRICAIKKFPYLVVYQITANLIAVLAIAHTSRRPGYWRRRRI